MINRFLLITTFLLFGSGVLGQTLSGNVFMEWSPEKAKNAIFQEAKQEIDLRSFLPINPEKGLPPSKNKVITTFNDNSYSIHITGQGIDDIQMYYTADGKLEMVAFLVLNSNENPYPMKCFKHTYPSGELISASLSVSQFESYEFLNNRELAGHWVNDKLYDKYGTVIQTRTYSQLIK